MIKPEKFRYFDSLCVHLCERIVQYEQTRNTAFRLLDKLEKTQYDKNILEDVLTLDAFAMAKFKKWKERKTKKKSGKGRKKKSKKQRIKKTSQRTRMKSVTLTEGIAADDDE